MTNQSNDEVLIRAEHVSKKFCRSLKRSLWYGAQDVANALMPWKQSEESIQNGESAQFPSPALRKDEFWAVRDVSFEVKRGECLGLIGHNGAGKSTLLKMLNSLNRPDAGRITMRGRVGALIELSAGFNPILSGRENIYNQAALLGFSKQETDEKFDAIVDFSELEEFLDMPVQNYSSGMQVRLGFAVASQMEPDVLIIDEVLAVGDAGFRHKCVNALAELMRNSAVVFVSHSMPQIQRVCSSVLHLDAGRIDYLGSPVAEGVKRYLGRFESAGLEVKGDGSVSVTNICMRRGSTDWSTSDDFHVAQNGELGIQFDLMCRADLPPMVVQVLFWNLELIPALEILDTQENGFRITESCKVSVQIDDLALSPGKYSLSVIVMSADLKKTFLHASNAASIVVSGGSATAAVCVKQANWHIQSNLIASND